MSFHVVLWFCKTYMSKLSCIALFDEMVGDAIVIVRFSSSLVDGIILLNTLLTKTSNYIGWKNKGNPIRFFSSPPLVTSTISRFIATLPSISKSDFYNTTGLKEKMALRKKAILQNRKPWACNICDICKHMSNILVVAFGKLLVCYQNWLSSEEFYLEMFASLAMNVLNQPMVPFWVQTMDFQS